MKITFFSILAVQVFLHDVITYAQPNGNAEAPATTGALLTLDHNTRIDSLVQTAIAQTILQQYDEALAFIDLVIKSTPNEPTGHFFKAAVLQARMMDYEDYAHDEKAFFSAAATCRKLAQAKLKERRDEAWAHFFYGSAMGYEAFLLGKKKRFLEAFRYGWQSLQHLEAALKINPQLHDAYLGIGTYKYYRSKMSKTFSWLPFVTDERAEGIHMIRQAIAHGRYSRTAAINGLSWILINENRPAEALALIDSALVKYPASRFFLWSAAGAAYRVKRHDQAAAHYRLILSSLQDENRLSPYLELVGRARLAKVYQAAGKADEACSELERIGILNLSKRDRERGEEFVQEAARYRMKCEETTNGKSRITEQK